MGLEPTHQVQLPVEVDVARPCADRGRAGKGLPAPGRVCATTASPMVDTVVTTVETASARKERRERILIKSTSPSPTRVSE